MTLVAKKVLKYRLEHELSIEEMANILEISPSRLDEMEKDKIVPDANELTKISKLLNVSIDDLLNEKEVVDGEVVTKTISDNQGDKIIFNKESIKFVDKDGEQVQIDKKGVHTNFEQNKEKIMVETINGIYSLLVLIAYILIGSFAKLWHPGWIIFLTIPLMSSITRSIRKRNLIFFNFPILTVIIFLLVGFLKSLWHPMWVIFLFIPVYYEIIHLIKNLLRRK